MNGKLDQDAAARSEDSNDFASRWFAVRDVLENSLTTLRSYQSSVAKDVQPPVLSINVDSPSTTDR